MRTQSTLGAALALLLVSGCGGGGGKGDRGVGEITGIVLDAAGKPVPGADVSLFRGGSANTTTDSSGRFIFENVSAGVVVVEAVQNGATDTFVGYNSAYVQRDGTAANVSVVLYDEDNLTTIEGHVDSDDLPLYAQVTAKTKDDVLKTSTIAFTDKSGNYTLRGIAKNVDYRMVVSSLPYRGDNFGDATVETKRISSDSDPGRIQDFALARTDENPSVAPAPSDLTAVTLPATLGVSPFLKARATAAQRDAAIEAVRRLRDPRRAANPPKPAVKPRLTAEGNPVELDLTWNPYTFGSNRRPFGYIVYRTEGGVDAAPYTLSDPLATRFYDNDAGLDEDTTYGYSLRAIGTNYEGGTTGRSAESTRLFAQPLGGLELSGISGRTVSWNAVTRATGYTVYVFNRFPGIGTTPAYTTTTATTSAPIPTGSTPSGTTYYVIVVGATPVTGSTATTKSETYSDIGSFAP